MAYYTAGVIGSYIRSAVTPAGFDISGSTVRANNLLVSGGTIRDAAGLLDISGGNIYIAGTLTQAGGAVTADGFVVAVGTVSGSGNTIAYSSNGSNWTGAGATAFSSAGRGVAWNGSLWVAVGSGTNSIAYSSDGSNWTGLGTSIFSSAGGIAWNGSLWVAAGAGTNSLAYSSDGSNWTGAGATTFTSAGRGVAWNGSLWVAAGEGTNSLAYSSDGSNWTGVGSSIFSTRAWSIAWNGSLWVAAGEGTNTLAYSSNGSNWTGLGTSTFSTSGYRVAWNGSLWVAVGQGTNTIAYSSDGSNWTGLGASTFSTGGYGVAWNGSLWIATGEGTNRLAYSSDGSNWTGAGSSIFAAGLSVATRRYVLPVIESVPYAESGGSVQYSGTLVGTNPAASNQIGGVTLRDSNAIIGGYIRNALAPTTLDISGGNISNSGTTRSSNFIGTAATSNQIGGVTFSNSDISMSATGRILAPILRDALTVTEFDISSGNILAANTLASTSIRVGLPQSTTLRGRIEAGSGADNAGGGGTPVLSMQFGGGSGGYRHFIRTRHNAATEDSGNAVDIFTNNSATAADSSAPGVSNRLAISMTSAGVGVGTTPSFNLDVSGTARTTGGVVTSFVRNALVATTFDISGGNISNSGTTRSANALISGYLRNALTPTEFDISGGNIYISGTLTQGGGGSTANLLVPGYIRNALTPTTLDISGGNISNSGTTSSGNFIGSFSTYNYIGGVELVNNSIFAAGGLIGTYVRNAQTATQFDISGGNISNSATTRSSNFIGTSSASNSIGGVTLSNTDITLAGTITGSTVNTSNVIGGVTLSNTDITLAGTITGSTANTSNVIGGVTLSNSNITLYGAITGFTADINNNIGGVVLSNNNISNGGTITTSGTLTFNSTDQDKLYWTTAGLMGSKVAHSVGWSVDMYAGSNGTNTGTFRFLRGATTGGGSAESLRITASGQVGIGTSAPAYALDVSSTSSIAQAIFRNPSGNQAGIYVTGSGWNDLSGLEVYHQGNEQGLYQNNSNPFYIWTKNTRRLAIDQSGNVGIGSGTDGLRNYRLAVRGTGSTTAGVVFANSGNQAPFVGMVYDEPNEALSFRTNTGTADLNCNAVTIKRAGATAGFVGINTNTPLYRLDISEAPTTASINMSTWPRFSISNVGFTRGVTALRGGVVQWNTFSNSLNTNLLSITHSAVSGTYFQILKPGIWSIDWQLANSAIGFIETYLDVCTSLASTTYAAIATMGSIVKYTRSESFVLGASYVGYLESNASTYYRIWTSAGGISNNNYSQLRIAYLGETNSNAIFPP